MRILTAVFVLLTLTLSAQASGGFISGNEIKSRAAAGPVKVKSSTDYELIAPPLPHLAAAAAPGSGAP